ncbi:MAG: hypothetical protein P4L66_10325 [Acetobacteraceae bacterium]|nr:hypothetical protein [Acetobacteraceae bacterium]
MTDTTLAHDSRADDLTTSLSRLEVALDRIAVASAATQMQTQQTASVVEAADDGVSAHLAGRLDSMIARLRTVIDTGEESTAWLRSA